MNMIQSRIALVVIKLAAAGRGYYLMRADPRWHDLNFIGGHLKPRDRESFERAAIRELWEEVPSVRGYTIALEPITNQLQYGPVYSRSKGADVRYVIQFFLLVLTEYPSKLVDSSGGRSKNMWIPEDKLTVDGRLRLSGFVSLLNSEVEGGLPAIRYSSATDLVHLRQKFEQFDEKQLLLALK